MKPLLEITVCYTILEKLNDVDILMAEDEVIRLAHIVRSHKLLLSEKLMELCENYFKETSPEKVQWYQDFCTHCMYTESRVKIVPDDGKNTISEKDPYIKELLRICIGSSDKILLTEKKGKILPIVKKSKLPLEVFNHFDLTEDKFENKVYRYTLPITRMMLMGHLDNSAVADWLKRFLQMEPYVQIFDNYLATGPELKALHKYILPSIKSGTEIHIYTLVTEELPEEKIKEEFQKKRYKDWKIQVFTINFKTDLHERTIQGENFIIQIDKGLGVFGKSGKIQKSPISIMENKESARTRIKENRAKQII